MARKPRIEVAGGLYHVITRGNDRQDIFHNEHDHEKFLALLAEQKAKRPFFLYAYCLMTNHIHLLIERQSDTVGKIMHAVLTGYSQYYNRRYRRVGHVFQGRHKSMLCQSERYLTELVRYIHLNPVRARMVPSAKHYPHCSHRAYVGLDDYGIVDVDPVLRHFAAKKEVARKQFEAFVGAGLKLPPLDEVHRPGEAGILGSDEFVDATIHRIGDVGGKAVRPDRSVEREFRTDAFLTAVETVYQRPAKWFRRYAKEHDLVVAREVVIAAGVDAGATLKELAHILGMSSSNTSRRYASSRQRLIANQDLAAAKTAILRELHK